MLSTGCYSPNLSSPGFYCHAGDNPACPDGQQCIGGRCQSKNRPSGGGDMASGGGEDQGSGPVDLANPFPDRDMAMSGGMTGCNGLVTCVNACSPSSTTCPMMCQNNTTAHGNMLFTSLINCLVAACPNAFPGDVCYVNTSTACSQCFAAAQSPGPPQGACYPQLSACHADLP